MSNQNVAGIFQKLPRHISFGIENLLLATVARESVHAAFVMVAFPRTVRVGHGRGRNLRTVNDQRKASLTSLCIIVKECSETGPSRLEDVHKNELFRKWKFRLFGASPHGRNVVSNIRVGYVYIGGSMDGCQDGLRLCA